MSQKSGSELIETFGAFHCEICGYDLGSLDPAENCPECGEPIQSSIPLIHQGSPWQQRRSPANLIRTHWMFFTHPAKSWDQLQIDKPSALSLIGWGSLSGMVLVSLLIIAPTLYALIKFEEPSMIFVALIWSGILSTIFVIGSFVYSSIAVLRMKFWSRSRQWRIGSESAWTIIGHASSGLFLIPVMVSSGILSWISASMLADILNSHDSDNPVPVVLLALLGNFMIFASIPVGIVVFEVLSSIGMRRLKFRNLHPSEGLNLPSSSCRSGPGDIRDSGTRMDIS